MAERGWHDEDAPRIEPAAGGPADGAYAAIAPDPERDSRRDAYRERERRRAARTLDRYIEIIIGDAGRPSALTEHAAVSAAGERFVEAMADYMRSWARTGTYDSHHKSHYDAIPPCTCGEPSGLSGCEQHMPEMLRRKLHQNQAGEL